MYYEDYKPELPDYLQAVEAVIEAEVSTRLKHEVKDLAGLREKQQSYSETIAKYCNETTAAKNELLKIQRDIERVKADCQKQIDEIKVKAVAEYLDGWDKVTEVFYLKGRKVGLGCPICGSKEYITREIDGMTAKVDCPFCKQYKWLREFTEYHVESHSSNIVLKFIKGKVTPITFYYDYGYNEIPLSTCYRTKEEAQAVADEMTGKNRAKVKESVMKFIKEKGWDKLIIKKEQGK